MRKSSFSIVRKAFMLASLLISVSRLCAQTDITIGTGTTGNTGTTYPAPIQDWYEGSRAQYLFKASELTAAGMSVGNISGLKWEVTNLNTFHLNIEKYQIKIGTSALTTLNLAAWEPGTTPVYGPVDYVPTMGTNTFSFSSPFFWNGTDNIIIEICNGEPINNDSIHYTNNVTTPWTTGLSFNASHTLALDNVGNLCSSTTTTNSGSATTRPNTTFIWTPAFPCAGPPTAGTVTANPTTVCLGQPISLSVSGVTIASGLTYQWQSGPSSAGPFTNITGATTQSTSTTQTVTTYYRFRVVCTATNDTAYTAAVQVMSPPVPGGVYTIDKTQPTNWPGTPGGTNFNSFNDAYNAVKCGISSAVTFNVVPGTGPYNEQLIMSPVPNTNATNRITFNGNGNTISFASANSLERAVIKLKGANFITFDSLTIDASAGTYGFGVQLMSDADSNIVRKCNIITSTTASTQNFAGIVISGAGDNAIATGIVTCDDNLFDHNTVTGGFYSATQTATGIGGGCSNNIFTNNNFTDFYNYGLYSMGSVGLIVEGNTFSRPTRTTVGDFVGVYFATEKNVAALISKNRFKNPFGGAPTSTANFYGIYFNTSNASVGGETMVVNNLIYNVNGNGPVYGINNIASGYVYYLHNTISLDYTASTATGLTRGFSQTTIASGLFFYDNIVSITRGGTGPKHAIYLASGLIAGSDYNDLYINATNAKIGYYTADRLTLQDWRGATGFDGASISQNPAYVDPSTENYSPGNAGMDNKGLYLGVDTDIMGVTRSTTTPDIGAYEFTPPPCSTPPVNGTTTISATTICQNNPVQLGLNIGPYGSAQTFQWQVSTTAGGPYTSIGTPMLTPDTTIMASQTYYYRAEVKCGSTAVYSNEVLLNVTLALPGGTYTIDQGTPTNHVPGQNFGNFNSFNAAKAAMSCGILGPVVFNVVPNSGPYTEALKLDSIYGTSPINTITFNGNGNTIINASSSTLERAVIKLNHADYIIFDSLRIDASTGVYGYGVQLINNADTNIFRKCTIISSQVSAGTTFCGVVINAADDGPVSSAPGNTLCDANLFDSNTIIGGYYGITVVGGATSILDNKFTNNTIRDYFSAGMYIAGTTNTLVEGNTFTRPVRTTSSNPVYGIQVTAAVSNGLNISKNRFTNLFGGSTTSVSVMYGIYHNSVNASAGNEGLVTNNLFYNLVSNGSIYTLYNNASNGVHYYHNTISLDDITSTAAAGTEAFYVNGSPTNVDFRNNLISIRRGGNGIKHAINLSTAPSVVTSDYNNFYVNSLGSNSFIGSYGGVNKLTLSDWQTTGKDLNSLSMDPVFKDPANGDFTPGILPLDNKGTPVGILTDILNAPRSTTTPDIGAYEFTPPACVNPIVAGSASVTPASGICLEQPITLNLTGNSPVGTITFQWQSSPDGITGWQDISPVQYNPLFNTTTGVNTYYRAAVTCSGNTVYSTIAHVVLNTILPAGTYTIDGTTPTTYVPGFPGGNFQTFQSAVTAMTCGIGGKVIFNVAPGTYTEQIRIPYVPGTSNTSTITFQSASGIPSSAVLTFSSAPANNYTLRLDSAKNIIFNALTISATNASYGRAVELVNGAANDSLINSVINSPSTFTNTGNMAGIYANQLKGQYNMIKGNTVNGGSFGIYLAGTAASNLLANQLIDSNTVSGAYVFGIYANFLKRAQITRNTINVSSPLASSAYGLYGTDLDSSFDVTGNTVNISNTGGTVYGIFITNSDSSVTRWSKIASNTINGTTGNAGNLYSLYVSNSPGHEALNNVIAINTVGANSYGIYNSASTGNYYNNSVNSLATSSTNKYAAYFDNTGTSNFRIRNNIFSQQGGGKAIYFAIAGNATSDYNMLYTSGATLAQVGINNYATINALRSATYYEVNSIVYTPAFVSNSDLHPALGNPDVWAMHGRGVQIATNNKDFNGNPRPTTLTTGVPDLGAFEFFPTSQPTLLAPITTTVPNEQVFMYGSDTVAKVKWTNAPPTAIRLKRYSGVVPNNPPLPAGMDSMYFYTKFENAPAPGTNPYDMTLWYIDPWQGSIPSQYQIGLGRTTQSNTWVVGLSSRVNVPKKTIFQSGLDFMDKFTGLVNPYAPPVLPDKDSSNTGRRFWVAYPINQEAGGSNQQMVVYLSARESANVQVKITGTSWVRNYFVPAGTVTQTEFFPKTGPDNAFLNSAGLFNRGISITSDVPIVAYAHITGGASSGASMLLPVGVWGYEYKALTITQDYGANSFSYFYVIADSNNTKLEITPTVAVQNAGMSPNTPYQVVLNQGDVFQVVASSQTTELTGSSVNSIPNSDGKCFPFAMFSGSSRTAIDIGCGSGGDIIMQQNFPNSAWGKHYLIAPSSNSTSPTSLATNVYRIAVKDPATVVKRNGIPLTGLVGGYYYQFNSNTADFIEADKPIAVAQFLTGSCVGVGDPEMMYLSPIEQGINNIAFYRNSREAININYLTMIIPTAGLSSLIIRDGTTIVTPDYVYPVPQNPVRGINYSVVVKQWTSAQQQVTVQSDSSFTAITYGLGSVESYGYNAGTLVKTLFASGLIQNTLNNTTASNDFTCEGTTFIFKTTLPLRATKLTWKFSSVPNLSPNADVILNNPTPLSATEKPNGDSLFLYQAPGSYSFSAPGIYPVEIDFENPDIEGCDKKSQNLIYVQVVPAPKTNFTITPNPGCQGDNVQFAGEAQTSNGINVSQWLWTFHDGTTSNTQNTSYTYTTSGTFNEKLHTTTPDGCIGDSVKTVVINARPQIVIVPDSVSVCNGGNTTFTIQSPDPGVSYNWYTAATGGTVANTGTSFTLNNVTADQRYYVEAVSTVGGCVSITRKKVTATVLNPLPLPVITVQSSTPTSVTFTWAAVPGAVSYQASVNGGAFTNVSGPGLTHTVNTTALNSVSVRIQAVGSNPCQNSISTAVSGCTDATIQVNPDSLSICPATTATFNVQSPVSGVTYNWYTAATGGTLAGTGTSFTTPSLSALTYYYVSATNATTGCAASARKKVTVSILGPLTPAVVTLDSAGANFVRFSWTAVAGAASYQVSLDGGLTWSTPSSGSTGLFHRITGLNPSQQVSILVRAIGFNPCQTSVSQPAQGRAINDNIYIPNSFSPNGDGVNDVLKVFSYSIKDMKFLVFNQWGEKVFESTNMNMAWDGKSKGKDQPSGVYMYVAKFTLLDNSTVERKGSVNLVR